MGIQDELAALQIDSLEHAVDQVSPIRGKYLALAREQNVRDQAGDPLALARLQAVTDACDRAIQLATVKFWPRETLCTRPLNLLTVEERNGL